jgi:hypothetical protein
MMAKVEELSKILEDDFGIKNERELDRAIEQMEKLDISIFVSAVYKGGS